MNLILEKVSDYICCEREFIEEIAESPLPNPPLV